MTKPKRQPKRSKLPESSPVHPADFKACLTCTKECEEWRNGLFLACPCPGHESAKIMAGVFSRIIRSTNALTS